MDQLTERLVEYAQTLSYEDLPPEVVERTKRLMLDTIGCALGAAPWQAPSIARALAADVQSRTPANGDGGRPADLARYGGLCQWRDDPVPGLQRLLLHQWQRPP